MVYHLSTRIRKIREAAGLRQSEVAYRLDISPSAYGQIERNAHKSTIETLFKIARAMNVSLTYLIDLEEEDEIKKNKL